MTDLRFPGQTSRAAVLAAIFVASLLLAAGAARAQTPADAPPAGPDAPPPPPPPGPTAADLAALSARVDAANQQALIAERKVELLEEQLAAKAKATPAAIPLADPKGYGVQSADGNFLLRIHGHMQVDSRWFLNDGALSDKADTFLIRRLRPGIDGTLFKLVDYRFIPDFAGGAVQVFSAYLDAHPYPWLRLRFGKLKPPLGLERLQQDADLPLMERALTQNLTAQRDLGAELWGEVADGILTYSIGFFNGAADATLPDLDNNHAKDVEGRVLLQPFRADGLGALGALGLHFGASTGERLGTPANPQLPSFKSGGQNTIFGYLAPTATADPTGVGTPFAHLRQTRYNPGVYYYVGPFGVLGEAVWSRQEIQKGNAFATVTNRAYHVTASVVIGGKNGYEGATPNDNLDPAHGHLGALELAARWNYLAIDDAAFGDSADPTAPVLADPTKSIRKAQGGAVGLNYVPNRSFRLAVNFEQTRFTGGAVAADKKTVADRNIENALFARGQVNF